MVEQIQRLGWEAWDLIGKGILQQWLRKTGDASGLVIVVNAGSLGQVRALAQSSPLA